MYKNVVLIILWIRMFVAQTGVKTNHLSFFFTREINCTDMYKNVVLINLWIRMFAAQTGVKTNQVTPYYRRVIGVYAYSPNS